MNISTLGFDNFSAYCEQLKNLSEINSIALSNDCQPAIMLGIPLAEEDLKKAAKKLTQVFLNIRFGSSAEQQYKNEALQKLEQFYSSRPAVQRKLAAGRQKLNNLNGAESKVDQECISSWQKSAAQGCPEAQCNLARLYYKGWGVEKDVHKALELFNSSAEQGFAQAYFGLALHYRPKSADDEATPEFLSYLKLAAEGGVAAAQTQLAIVYKKGKGVKKDEKKAFELFTLAAEQKERRAQAKLAQYYLHGILVEKDRERALVLLTASAEQGFPAAQYDLALCLRENNNPEENPKIVSLLQSADAQGYGPASYELGKCYIDGDLGLARDRYKAVEIFRAAADRGYADCQYELAMCYLTGAVPLKNINTNEALNYLQESAEHGYESAVTVLSEIFVREVLNNKNESYLKYFKNSAKEYAWSQYLVGLYYAWDTIEKDHKKAFQYFESAANQGVEYGDCALGQLYEEHGDLAKAITHYQLAAEADLDEAKSRLRQLQSEFPGLKIV